MTPPDPGPSLRYLQPIADMLAPALAVATATLVPCSADEITALEALVAPHRLPAAYREFLAYGGKQLAGVFGSVDFSYALVWTEREHGNRDIRRMLEAWDRNAVLPESVFVINEHLGSSFTYFDLGEGDDPPVYFWEEGSGGLDTAVREHDTFSAFVLIHAQRWMKLASR
jgi:SMI1/KNR4 family protein SUKH-1